MNSTLVLCISVIFLQGVPAIGQETPGRREAVPIYSVTVVERSTKSINYQYRALPTKIDFRGTVLLTEGKDEKTVDSHRGRNEIDPLSYLNTTWTS